jgi:hypothetical protein
LLDKVASKGLPDFYTNVKSHRLAIRQDDARLIVGVEIQLVEGSPVKIDLPYNLNGSETKTEMPVRTSNGDMMVPATLKAELTANGGLKITISREMKMRETSFTAVSIEEWKLSGDGKTLNIHRTDETPRGKIDADMIFVKQS